MNLDIIKKKILQFKGTKLKIKVNLGRNKYEYFEGYIEKIHPNIFTVHTNSGIKSFSYSDIIVRNVVITKFK